MKVFIVFLALLMVNIGFITFQDDHTVYENMQYSIRRVAEDCAYGCSMYFDSEAYSEGFLIYDTEEAVRYIESVLQKRLENDSRDAIKELHYTAYFFNEDGTCRIIRDGNDDGVIGVEYPYILSDDQGYEETVNEPMVKVVVTAETEDIFRQDFLYSRQIIRSSSYGNKPY
ncbi:MAG: hypothetical protein IKV96_01065 [Firmicutes bacterium]|nr:hypothetical protein [Bacillota bacterium]